MKQKNETYELNEAIFLLENKRADELILLKEQLHLVHETLKPINIIKRTFHEVTTSPEIKNNFINNTIGLVTGYLTKKVIFGGSHNPLKKLFGAFLQFAVTNIISKHSDGIKSVGENILNQFFEMQKRSNTGVS